MSLKNKFAKIKMNIKENPAPYVGATLALTTGVVATIATVMSIKHDLENGRNGIHVLLVNDECMRSAKDEGRPIMFRYINGEWYFKNVDPND